MRPRMTILDYGMRLTLDECGETPPCNHEFQSPEPQAFHQAFEIETTGRKQRPRVAAVRRSQKSNRICDDNTRNARSQMVGYSAAFERVIASIRQVAPTDSTVLITGETGTGKELVANAIHNTSLRKGKAFIKVNCGALPASLVETEIFGYEKGAFTGALSRKPGRFELANGGTLFLDEIGELPIELQVKLLRVIQENEFERVGGTQTIKTNVRIITATNRVLKTEVANGRFREDLWYRLNVYPINVPALRQRTEDIPLLAEHFVKLYTSKMGRVITSISPAAVRSLQSHSWPG